jgi:hypothetical protein
MQRYPLYIGGDFRDSASGSWCETENPYTL